VLERGQGSFADFFLSGLCEEKARACTTQGAGGVSVGALALS
jgi:hypothetical protein